MTARHLAIVCSALCPLVLSAADWPQWRGPAGNGSSPETGLPDSCEPAQAKWTLPLPGESHATPAVWGTNVIVLSPDPATDAVLAICAETGNGKVRWQTKVGSAAKAPRNNGTTPSPVTDGTHVWTLLGSGELTALDLASGQPRWTRNLVADHGNLCTKFGYSSSPLLWNDTLFVQLLRRPKPYSGEAGKDPLDSLVLALDPRTGKERWQHVRRTAAVDESHESYSTPVPFPSSAGKQLLVQGGDCLTAHDPATGGEIWRLEYNPKRATIWRLIPSPVVAGDTAVAMLPRGGPLVAVKAGIKGTIEPGAALWTYDERTSDSGSALLYQNYLHILQSDKSDPWNRGSKSSSGIFLLVVDPATGKEVSRCLIAPGGAWRASPTGADGKIYLLSEKAEMVVVTAGPNGKILSRADFADGPACATIAVANGCLFLRTASKLSCFAK